MHSPHSGPWGDMVIQNPLPILSSRKLNFLNAWQIPLTYYDASAEPHSTILWIHQLFIQAEILECLKISTFILWCVCLHPTEPQFLTSSISNSCWFCVKQSDLAKLENTRVKTKILFSQARMSIFCTSKSSGWIFLNILRYVLCDSLHFEVKFKSQSCTSWLPLLEITTWAGKPMCLTSLIRKLHVSNPRTRLSTRLAQI